MTEEKEVEEKQENGQAEKILKQTSVPKKIAKIFSIVWILAVVLPAVRYVWSHSAAVKEYAVVKAAAEGNALLLSQYDTFSAKLLNSVNVEKYAADIKIPDIKIEKLSLPEQSQKVQKAAEKSKKLTSALGKLGVKDTGKIDDAAASLQKQVDKLNGQLDAVAEKVNGQVKSAMDKTKTALNKNIRDGLKKEVDSLAKSELRKQIGLNDGAYDKLTNGRFAFGSQSTTELYGALSKSPLFLPMIKKINAYWRYVLYGLLALVVIIGMIPPFIANKIAKILSSVYTQCPYCKKVYITKQNAFNFLKLLKIV